MCGIAGIYSSDGVGVDGDLVARMTDSLRHRGPDGDGYYRDSRVGLGHRRLSIIDLENGEQPFYNEDRSVVLIGNGEIYNFRSLREGLLQRRHRFGSRCDIEVIVHLYEEHGIDFLSRLNGMFAVALYDRERRTLFLARDRLGIKPLYYGSHQGRLLFGSEIKAILQDPSFPRRVDASALHDFLTFSYFLPPATFFEAVRELRPGHFLEVQPAGVREVEWWRSSKPSQSNSGASPESRFETLFDEAIDRQLMSDVPLGTFLSGGLDSSLVTAFACRHLDDGLDTFHTRFSEAGYDESRYAESVALRFGTRHTVLDISTGTGSFDQLRGIVDHFDQPFGDSSCIPTYLMCREVAKRCKVVLSGDGGDELFYGYQSFVYLRWLQRLGRIPRVLRAIASGLVRAARPLAPTTCRRLLRLLRLSRLDPLRQVIGLKTYWSEEEKAALYTEEWRRRVGAHDTIRRVEARLDVGCCRLQLMDDFNRTFSLNADMLRKVDTASMAHGLEVRVPFLDNACIEFAAGLPARQKIHGNRGKRLLRAVSSRHLPSDVVAHKKSGFEIPLDTWVDDEFVSEATDYLLGRDSRLSAIVRSEAVQELLQRFAVGAEDFEMSRYQSYQRLFMLLSVEVCLRKWNCIDHDPGKPDAGRQHPATPRITGLARQHSEGGAIQAERSTRR